MLPAHLPGPSPRVRWRMARRRRFGHDPGQPRRRGLDSRAQIDPRPCGRGRLFTEFQGIVDREEFAPYAFEVCTRHASEVREAATVVGAFPRDAGAPIASAVGRGDAVDSSEDPFAIEECAFVGHGSVTVRFITAYDKTAWPSVPVLLRRWFFRSASPRFVQRRCH